MKNRARPLPNLHSGHGLHHGKVGVHVGPSRIMEEGSKQTLTGKLTYTFHGP